jgi:hypothetical protein
MNSSVPTVPQFHRLHNILKSKTIESKRMNVIYINKIRVLSVHCSELTIFGLFLRFINGAVHPHSPVEPKNYIFIKYSVLKALLSFN